MTKTQPHSPVEALFHISDDPNIVRFDPRLPPSPSSGQTGLMVWAVGERLLHNYLLPRDCPRVTFYAGPTSSAEDVARLMGTSTASHVVAIESSWMPALRSGVLYQYVFPPETFTPVDAGAGYYISRAPVVPLTVTRIDDILAALLVRDVELRIMPSLWKLHDAVVASTLQFSIIRMRNAQPRA
jgi:hypothetical protein